MTNNIVINNNNQNTNKNNLNKMWQLWNGICIIGDGSSKITLLLLTSQIQTWDAVQEKSIRY